MLLVGAVIPLFGFRTYVRNSYTYHLSEIFYTIVNEYTDWERTVEVCFNLVENTINPIAPLP
jgi:hypothetical protein